MATDVSPTLTDSGLVTMTEVLWKTLTLTTGPYFLALGTEGTVNSPKQESHHSWLSGAPLSGGVAETLSPIHESFFWGPGDLG